MNSDAFEIDSRLLNDSHPLFSWNQCHIRLNKNATIPWFLIIPETTHTELCDLPEKQLQEVNQVAKILGDYMKTTFACKKINFAAIGNVVQQLHIHVIGRHSRDPLWPDVVWGNQYPVTNYDQAKISQHTIKLQNLINHTHR